MFRNDTMMADGPRKKGDPNRPQGAPGPTPEASAETKRLEARRRFLLGGAAALPAILTVTEVKAQEQKTSPSNCASLGRGFQSVGPGAPFSGVCIGKSQ